MPPLIRKIEPGDVIGRCRLVRELGRGGVGTVYLATHQTLQIEVALKILSPSLSMDNPALAERFIREAQLAARIRHPNVIAVMDAAHDEAGSGLYYIVMEYIGGGSLSWHLRHGALPEAKALSIVNGIAHALVLAAENGIVHRDIKPDNIMLDLRGTPKLADLGLAKHAIDSRTSLTLGGSFMGTPAYMSPEQARDAKVADTRDDIYSLGATFYECLTGEPPFQGETPYNIMSELLTKPSPRPRDKRPEISRSADLICRKMMAKNRQLRYADARALLHDLQICQTLGDKGLDRLEASTFERDSLRAKNQAMNYGVETSADGVAVVPDPPDDSTIGTLAGPVPALISPRRVDHGAFGVAFLLIAFVTVATLFFAWIASHHPLTFLRSELAQATPQPTAAPEPQYPTNVEPAPVDVAPVIPGEIPTPAPAAVATPAPVPPANPGMAINPTPAIPANPGLPGTPVPAAPATPDSAFAARAVAENSLDTGMIGPTGQAELLRIVGKRDEKQLTPSTWAFYFFDKGATGHARIVTVNGGKVVKSGEDLLDLASPYSEHSVMPEDKLQIDSSQALAIAQGLIPGTPVTSADYVLLRQKNFAPMWKVALWALDRDGEERKIGEVTLLAENGALIFNNLKP
ncbi:MAG: serine/threonine protein kinase [Methylacidiphilales bacterium]|nr:serine/threonine protein kinase [Candidatus Methylacidiphilales bacterium]